MATSSNSIRLPDGREASFEEMQAYGSVLQSFIQEQEAQLPAISDARHHNDTIDYLQSLANAYNEQLHVYRDTQAQQHTSMMVALLQFAN